MGCAQSASESARNGDEAASDRSSVVRKKMMSRRRQERYAESDVDADRGDVSTADHHAGTMSVRSSLFTPRTGMSSANMSPAAHALTRMTPRASNTTPRLTSPRDLDQPQQQQQLHPQRVHLVAYERRESIGHFAPEPTEDELQQQMAAAIAKVRASADCNSPTHPQQASTSMTALPTFEYDGHATLGARGVRRVRAWADDTIATLKPDPAPIAPSNDGSDSAYLNVPESPSTDPSPLQSRRMSTQSPRPRMARSQSFDDDGPRGPLAAPKTERLTARVLTEHTVRMQDD